MSGNFKVRVFGYCWLVLVLSFTLVGCGVKVEEADARAVMKSIYKARKSQNVSKELRYYAKKDFDIVPFDEMEASLRNLVQRAGRLKKITALDAKTQNRNQLGKGMVKYLILSYEVTYTNMTVTESYYFLGSSETPKLVYMTFQL